MNKKSVLSTLGVIVLGALGSALWDFTKPIISSVAATLANLSTLGIESLRDDLYARAASSLGRPIGIATSIQFLAGWMAILLTGVMHVLSLSSDPRVCRFARAYMILFFTLAITLSAQSVRGAYAVQLAMYYAKLEVLAAPHISDAEAKQARASFALVRTKSEYLRVTEALSIRIRAAGGAPPPVP